MDLETIYTTYNNMILATKIQSEKGKEITKTANEFIDIIITGGREIIGSYRVDHNTSFYNITDNETGDIIKTIKK